MSQNFQSLIEVVHRLEFINTVDRKKIGWEFFKLDPKIGQGILAHLEEIYEKSENSWKVMTDRNVEVRRLKLV